jgi:hypothetical protein
VINVIARAAFFFATIAVLAACASAGGPPRPATPVSVLLEAEQRRWNEGHYVFRTQEAWSTAWSASPALTVPESRPPAVDFAQYMIVGIAAGWGPNGCAGLVIRRATEDATTMFVEYLQSDGRAPPGVACTAALVQLVSFAKVPRSGKPVKFVRIDGQPFEVKR